MMPSDTHSFYDNIPCENESRKMLKRQQLNIEKQRQDIVLETEGAKKKKKNNQSTESNITSNTMCINVFNSD